ncbi:MAG: sulfatase [bacterium]|nr:sulfatase [bacterium]
MLGLVGAATALAIAARTLRSHDERPLPPEVQVTDVLHQLSDRLDATTVVAEDSEAPVSAGGLQPSPSRGYRRAIVAPPPATLRFPVPPTPGAALRIGFGMEPAKKPPATAAGVRFVATLNERTVLDQVVDPVGASGDRRWFDVTIPLPAEVAEPLTLTLATTRHGSGPLAGTPGWSRVQLVREAHIPRQASGPAAPNVLVLLVDTLRADHLGVYGAQPSPSPRLDRLAAQGRVFEQAVAQAPWTLPSVATLFTGLHPRSHGVVGRSWRFGRPAGVTGDADWAFLSDSLPTIATQARRAGISTIGVSANGLVSRENNLARGFETFVELPRRERGDDVVWARGAEVNAPFLDWLRRNRGRRFFAWLQYMEAHEPYQPVPGTRPPAPPGIDPQVRDGVIRRLAEEIRKGERPPLSAVEVAYLRTLYHGAIAAWDGALGELVAALEAEGVLRDTIVVVTADHGEEFQEHGLLGHRKHLYDESLHVPMIVFGPGVTPGREPAQVQGIDLFPTVAAVLGLELPRGLPGKNVLAPDLARDREAWSETRYGAGPDGSEVELDALRTPERKLIWAPPSDLGVIYDLVRDPGEQANAWSGDAADAAMRERLSALRAAAAPPPPVGGADPGLEDKLRALGYLD